MRQTAKTGNESDQLRLWSSLVELNQIANSAESASEVCEALADTVTRFIAYDRLSVRLIDQESGAVTNIFVTGAPIHGSDIGDSQSICNTITGTVVESGRSLLIRDGRTDPLRAKHPALVQTADDLPALAAVPLRTHGTLLGGLLVRSHTPGQFAEADLSVLEAIATHAAPALENALHVEGLAAEAEEREVILELGRTINTSLDIDSVFERFAGLVSQIIPSERLVINTLDPEGTSYTVRFIGGVDLPAYKVGDAVDLAGTMTEAVIEKRSSAHFSFAGPEKTAKYLEMYPVIKPAYDAGIRSLLAAPMIVEGRVIGTFHAQSTDPFAYTSRHEELIRQVAELAASAVARSDLLRRIERESTERQVLAEIGRVIGSALDFGDVFELVAGEVRKLLPADRVVITTVDDGADVITDRYISGPELPVWDSKPDRPLRGLLSETVVKERRTTISLSEDGYEGSQNAVERKETLEAGLHTTMMAPMVSNDRVIGTINVKSRIPRAYSESDVEVLKAIAQQIAGAVVASDLYLETVRLADERERRVQAESEIRELLRVNQAKSDFLSKVSHELKTPLTSILAFTGFLRKNQDGGLSKREVNQLEVIKRNGERLDRLISDLVDVSLLEADAIRLVPIRFDLRRSVVDLIESFSPAVEAKFQSIRLSSPDERIEVHADADRVNQVVANLLSNASKYSLPGSNIDVDLHVQGDVARIEVSDEGIGVSQSDLENLFTAFFRADNQHTRSQPGTGLGLVIARSIAEMHGGKLTVTSEPDEGTTFTFVLPLEFRGRRWGARPARLW